MLLLVFGWWYVEIVEGFIVVVGIELCGWWVVVGNDVVCVLVVGIWGVDGVFVVIFVWVLW